VDNVREERGDGRNASCIAGRRNLSRHPERDRKNLDCSDQSPRHSLRKSLAHWRAPLNFEEV
jgi:hypothetical protein